MLQVNRNNTPEKDPEVLLKEKMEELSSSVDCFDKIASRAFPQNDLDFSESGFVVSDLENITDKPNHLNVLKWIAITAAAALAVSFVPQTNAFRSFMSNLSDNSSRQFFQMAAGEISGLSDDPDYLIYDVPLSWYVQNDLLVTPLMSCPFSPSKNDDAKVRLFIRTLSGIPTNQVSAVEYTGTYTQSNFIAAAQSAYRFTDQDVSDAQSLTFYNMESDVLETVENNFSTLSDNLVDSSGTVVSLASFSQNCFIKDSSGVAACTVDVIYGHDKIKYDGEGYFYDILYARDGNITDLPERSSWWEKSIRSNGLDEKPDPSESKFTRTDIFGSDASPFGSPGWGFINPYCGASGNTATDAVSQFDPEEVLSCSLWIWTDQGGVSTIIPPVDRISAMNMKLYFPPYRFASQLTGYSNTVSGGLTGLKVKSNTSELNESFSLNSLFISDTFYDALISEAQHTVDSISENQSEYGHIDKEAASQAEDELNYLKSIKEQALEMEELRRMEEEAAQRRIAEEQAQIEKNIQEQAQNSVSAYKEQNQTTE